MSTKGKKKKALAARIHARVSGVRGTNSEINEYHDELMRLAD